MKCAIFWLFLVAIYNKEYMEIVEIGFSENCFVIRSKNPVGQSSTPCLSLLILLRIFLTTTVFIRVEGATQQSFSEG